MKKLQHEKKEIEQKYEQLKFNKDSVSLDRSRWREWDTNQVYVFMMNIDNGALKKYQDVLKKSLIEAEILGKHLEMFTSFTRIQEVLGLTSEATDTLQQAITNLTNDGSMVNNGNQVEDGFGTEALPAYDQIDHNQNKDEYTVQ